MRAAQITVKGGRVVIRMTWARERDRGLQCFSDDAYRFVYTTQRIKFLPDHAKHSFRDLSDKAPFDGLTRLK